MEVAQAVERILMEGVVGQGATESTFSLTRLDELLHLELDSSRLLESYLD